MDLSAALTDAKTKDRQKVEVLGYIGHDLRAPLATISGYSALLLANADEKQHKILETIQRSVKYQLDLIDELLEYAKAELQPLTVQPGTTDLPRLLDEISEYAIALCSQQSNRFSYRPSDRLPRQVILDGKRLQQVLLNLLSNAAKFTRDGVVTLSVTAQSQDKTCALHFAVSDTGIGIDLNKNADIFGAFQHIQSASGSTGLGLFIAQRIVSAMGGTLSVTSIAEQGTTFSFVLSAPIVDPSDSNWSSARQRQIDPPARRGENSQYSGAELDDQALDELATLALLGRLTDIERWIELHSEGSAPTPFMTHLRGLLEQFDFTAIEELALTSRGQSTV
ncbi:sensor histidine kinase [Ottowia thiooxydans]